MNEYVYEPSTSDANQKFRDVHNQSWGNLMVIPDRNLYIPSARSEPIDHPEYVVNHETVFYRDDSGNYNTGYAQHIEVQQQEYIVEGSLDQIPVTNQEIVSTWTDDAIQTTSYDEGDTLTSVPKIRCSKCDDEVNQGQAHTSLDCEKRVKKKFGCDQCGSRFNKEVNWKVHRWTQHAETDQQDKCQICDREFEKDSRLEAKKHHFKMHSVDDSYCCTSCEEVFEIEFEYKRHKRWIHKAAGDDISELLHCPECQEVIPIEDLKTHASLHVAYRLISKPVSKKDKLKKGTISKKHQCPKCDKSFVRPAELKRHSMTHLRKDEPGTAKWHCAMCDKQYSHQTGLNEHKRLVHTQSTKVHKCTVCGMEFSKKCNLDRHVIGVHPLSNQEDAKTKGKKGKKAKGSDKRKSLVPHVQQPVQPSTSSTMTHTCPFCPSTYKSLRTLNYHINAYHNLNNGEQTTGLRKDGRPAKKILTHERLYGKKTSFECSLCQKFFGTEAMLQKHKESHRAAGAIAADMDHVYKCDDCEKTYHLKSSLFLHCLTEHKMTESTIAPPGLTCPRCYYKASSASDYASHQIHSKLYGCRGCLTGPLQPIMINQDPQSQAQLTCTICQPYRRFPSARHLAVHKQSHLPRRAHLCWTCHKSFKTSALLNLHKAVHAPHIVQCEECGASFQGRGNLLQHKRTTHNTNLDPKASTAMTIVQELQESRNLASAQSFGEYGLENEAAEPARAQSADWMVIPANYQQQQQQYHPMEVMTIPNAQSQMIMQMADQQVGNDQGYQVIGDYEELLLGADVEVIDSGVAPIRCAVCLHAYDNIDHLMNHWQTNADEREHSFAVFTCPLCDYSARGVADGVQHVRNAHRLVHQRHALHSQQKRANYLVVPAVQQKPRSAPKIRYTCEKCERQFKKKSDFINHIRIHNDERPFVCDVCQQAFRTSSTLNRHKMIHSGVMFECTTCNEKFHCKSSLKDHLLYHTGETPYPCGYCMQSFRTRQLRYRHMLKVHPDIVPQCRCQLPTCSDCQQFQTIQENRVDEQILTAFFKDPGNLELPKSSTKRSVPRAAGSIPKTRKSTISSRASARAKQAAAELALQRAMATVTALPRQPQQLMTSKTSAFDTPAMVQQTSETSDDLVDMTEVVQDTSVVYFVARRQRSDVYLVTVSYYSPSQDSVRESTDILSSLATSQLDELSKGGHTFSIVLYGNTHLNVSARLLMNTLLNNPAELMDRKVSVTTGNEITKDNIFSISRSLTMTFQKRCEVCEEEFEDKISSDNHFASEDHETAMHTSGGGRALMNTGNPAENLQTVQGWQEEQNFIRKDGELACRLCGKRCMDMDLLVAHIEREHNQSMKIPARPVARTAPIH